MWSQKRVLSVCAIFTVGSLCVYRLHYSALTSLYINRGIDGIGSSNSRRDINVDTNATSIKIEQNKVNSRPKILIWAKPYHKIGWKLVDLPEKNGGCDVTLDRNEYGHSDAVLFYMKSCVSTDVPDPTKRKPHQAFVWWAHESPWTVLHYYKHDLKDFDNYFNWTMTYRRDSDVLASFAPSTCMDYLLYKFDRSKEMKDSGLLKYPPLSDAKFREEMKLLISKKNKFIAWVVSDCNFVAGASKRMKLVDSMTKDGLLNVDRFGKCVNRPIPDNFNTFFDTVAPYKFYLSFENSLHCRDYITEKTFYNALVGGIVPIIHGPTKEDAEKALPKNSFIHVEDFEDLTKLAEHLKYLDANDTAYLEYFRWWKEPGTHTIPRYGFNYGVDQSRSTDHTTANWFQSWKPEDVIQTNMMEFERFGLYHLCRKLRDREHVTTSKTISDLNQWWYGTEAKECYA